MGKIIKVKNIYKTYGDLHAVHNITMEVQRGNIYGLIGLNGAGKTTLIKLLLGIIKPTKGSCTIFGEKVSHRSSYLWNNVGYVVENAQAYPDLTVYENLLIQRKLYRITNRRAIHRVLSMFQLEKYTHKKVAHLSLGNKQRLALAKALIHRPSLLILDEPVNGLDPEGIVDIRLLLQQLAEEEKVTILLSSHLLDEMAKLATTIGMIHEGSLIKEVTEQQLQKQLEMHVLLNAKNKNELQKLLTEKKYAFQLLQDGSVSLSEKKFVQHPERLAQFLVNKGIQLTKLSVERESLEQYFLRTIKEKKGANI